MIGSPREVPVSWTGEYDILAAFESDEFMLQAARRMVAANPDGTYMGPVADELLAIPVLEIELDREGRVRRIEVNTQTEASDHQPVLIELA